MYIWWSRRAPARARRVASCFMFVCMCVCVCVWITVGGWEIRIIVNCLDAERMRRTSSQFRSYRNVIRNRFDWNCRRYVWNKDKANSAVSVLQTAIEFLFHVTSSTQISMLFWSNVFCFYYYSVYGIDLVHRFLSCTGSFWFNTILLENTKTTVSGKVTGVG